MGIMAWIERHPVETALGAGIFILGFGSGGIGGTLLGRSQSTVTHEYVYTPAPQDALGDTGTAPVVTASYTPPSLYDFWLSPEVSLQSSLMDWWNSFSASSGGGGFR